jgi:hypothetical protein
MTTGYFYGDWRQGGSVPGKVPIGPGGLLTVLDWMMLEGPSPWSKTVDGTNLATYTAPGGSQIALQFDDSLAAVTSYHARVRATVGGQVFPTPAQETNGSLGYVQMRRAYNTSNQTGWFAIRTDRSFVWFTNNITGVNGAASYHIFGDMPVIDPADPGLCISLGWVSSSYPTQNQNSASILSSSALYGSSHFCGYAYTNKAGTVLSVPVSLRMNNYTSQVSTPLSSWAGQIPMSPFSIWTGTTQSTSVPILRGWAPWMYPFLSTDANFCGGNTTVGDTLSAGSATFELHEGPSSTKYAFMTNDQEDLP